MNRRPVYRPRKKPKPRRNAAARDLDTAAALLRITNRLVTAAFPEFANLVAFGGTIGGPFVVPDAIKAPQIDPPNVVTLRKNPDGSYE